MIACRNNLKTSSAKTNSGWKPKRSERDCHMLKRMASKNHRTTAAKVTAELSVHLEDPVSTKQSNESCTNPSTVELQLLNLWVLKTMLKGERDGVVIIKPWHMLTGNTWFPNNDAIFQDDNLPIHTARRFGLCLRSVKRDFNIIPGWHNCQTYLSLNHYGQF
jgi:hypothetical protein